MLKASRLDEVLADLQRRGGDVEVCRRAVGCLAERRTGCATTRASPPSLPIGSGSVEAGCKNVVGRRMERTGKRWRQSVLWLRCARVDGYWSVCGQTRRMAA